MRYVAIVAAMLTVCGLCMAGGPEKGENETAFRLSYSDTDFGSTGGLDFGSSQDTDVSLAYGWYLTDSHELGLSLGYVKQEIKGGSLGPDASIDGTQFGGFYNYNFSAGTTLTPYLGASLATMGGDLGDAYDFSYGVEFGVKVYPFEHGGFSFGLSYSELLSDTPGLPDASGINLGAGLLLKY